MQYLLDTGILLRLVNRQAVMHDQIRTAVRTLKSQGHVTVSAFQNRAEFWNVCTRPSAARGGLGLSSEETDRRIRTVERITGLLPDSPEIYSIWKNLVVTYAVKGASVHDARLVALMIFHHIPHILTLNAGDFLRYKQITPVSPEQIIAAKV